MLSRQWHLVRRPAGLPTQDDVRLVPVDLGPPGQGQVSIKNHFLSVEPYMWGRMTGESTYTAPFALGEAMTGHAVGEVVTSNSEAIPAGAIVLHEYGWRDHAVVGEREARVIDVDGVPPAAWLGVLGLTGFTAWVGMHRVARLQPGETVLVSAAAGAVGSTAVQLAKAMGCTVIASAGDERKLAYVRDVLGADAVFSRRTESIRAALGAAAERACGPGAGIDVYFDNVGGEQLEAAIRLMRPHGRIVLCGAVSTYSTRAPGPRNLLLAIWRELRLEGFLVGSHEDARSQFESETAALVKAGSIRPVETVGATGIEGAFGAFRDMLGGANLGKMVVAL